MGSAATARRTVAGRCVFLAVILSTASGCVSAPQSDSLLASDPATLTSTEIIEVPFFPQLEYQCGPAALATVLNWSGVNVTPEELASQVFLPARRGTLQLELVAATRRQQRIPYVIEPNLNALLGEVSSGTPVLVFQNLALDWFPQWHYAVVVGYDAGRQQLILRSGTEKRHAVGIRTFEATWRRAHHWAMVVTPPQRVPTTARPDTFLKAALELERLGLMEQASTAYEAALQRWPEHQDTRFALGNAYYRQGNMPRAEQAFRALLSLNNNVAHAHNNLAQVLLEQRRLEEALEHADAALRLGGPHMEQYQRTVREISRLLGR